jgi:hypothetical protein
MTRDGESIGRASRGSFARAERVPEKMNTEPQSRRDQKRKTDFCRFMLVPEISPAARTWDPFDLLLFWAPWLCGSVFNSSGTRPARTNDTRKARANDTRKARAHGTRPARAHGTRKARAKTSTEAMPQEAC